MRKLSDNKTAILVVVFILIGGLATTASAFDKERKGFILGLGMGPGFSSFSETFTSTATGSGELFDISESKFSFLTDFKAGYAPSNQLMIYWMSKVVWFSKNDSTTFMEDKTTATGVGGIGITYFLKPEAPSLFVSAGGGLSHWSYPFATEAEILHGFGFAGGIGYEFSQNWNMELSFLWGAPSDESETLELKHETSTIAFGLTINVLGY